MATGLGKTYTAAETFRRLIADRPLRVLAVAHTNELVYQLERAFWQFLRPSQATAVWNGYERPSTTAAECATATFASLRSLYEHLERQAPLPEYDIL